MRLVASLAASAVVALVSLAELGCARGTPEPVAASSSEPESPANRAPAVAIAEPAQSPNDGPSVCCCIPPADDARPEMMTTDVCGAHGGSCLLDEKGRPDESECHGIEGPIPDDA
jgi:hypothetical protein